MGKIEDILKDPKYVNGVRLLEAAGQEMEMLDYGAARDILARALQFFQQKDVPEMVAYIYLEMAFCSLNLCEIDKEIDYYNKALDICKRVKEVRGEAEAYNNLSNAYLYLGKYDEAIKYSNNALYICKQIKDVSGEAYAYNNLGKVYLCLGKYEMAIEYFNNALAIYQQIRDVSGEAKAYNNLGHAYFCLDKYDEAIKYYEEALKIFTEIKDVSGEASAYLCLSSAYGILGKYDEMINYSNNALDIYQQIKDVSGEASAYINLSSAYGNLGKYDETIKYSNNALDIYQQIRDVRGEAKAYINLGNAYLYLGKYEKAIEYFNNALEICKQIKDVRGEASAYNNLGNAYLYLGKYDEAIKYSNNALYICKQIKDVSGEARVYNNLGNAYFCLGKDDLGKYDKAIASYDTALYICKQIKDVSGEASAYNNLANAYLRLGKDEMAIGYFNNALAIYQQIRDISGEAKAYNNLGMAYQNLGKYKKAIENYNKALKICKQIEDVNGEAKVYTSLSLAYRKLGKYEDGIEYGLNAIGCCEKIKGELKVETHQISFFGTVDEIYMWVVKLCIEHGRDETALDIIERSKSRAFISKMLGRKDIKPTKESEELRKLIEERKELRKKIEELALHRESESKRIPKDERMRAIKETRIEETSKEIDKLKVRYNQVIERIHEVDPKYYCMVEVPHVNIKEVKERLGEDIGLVDFYYVSRDEVGVVFLDKNRIKSGIKKFEEKKVDEILDSMKAMAKGNIAKSWSEVEVKAKELIPDNILEMILEKKEIWICAHQKLHFFPFAALRCDDGKYLIEKVRIREYPSVTFSMIMDGMDRKRVYGGERVVIGNPTGDLTNAEEEATIIANIVEAAKYTPRDVGGNISVQLGSDKLKSSSLYHYAGHVVYDSRSPWLSGMLFGDRVLSADDIMDMRVNNEVVVLSGCESGRGETRTGDEIVGLSRAMMYAGTKAIVATLWEIKDVSTAKFMECIYEEFWNNRCDLADAVRNAQLKFIQRKVSEGWSHPYYWAGFVVLGEKRI